jgi:hypothetical protein
LADPPFVEPGDVGPRAVEPALQVVALTRKVVSANLTLMSTHPAGAATPLLDEWIAEVGEEQVVASVRTAIQAIEDGTIPGFTDKQALLAYIGRHASR